MKKGQEVKRRRKSSLLVRYLLLMLGAFLIWPFIFPVAALLYYVPQQVDSWLHPARHIPNPYASRKELEERWHREAGQLSGAQPDSVTARLHALHEELPEARMFWVDGQGLTQASVPGQELQTQWSTGDTIAFMKKSYGGDPYTVVSFLEGDPQQGFMVIQVDKAIMDQNSPASMDGRKIATAIGVVFIVFLGLSGVFFYHFRRRLVRLEQAMSASDGQGIPYPVEVRQEDEIGRLEHAFNRMIGELHEAKEREWQEEMLRKQLIASLSHDLRTPLTIIRSHAYTLGKERLPEEAQQSVALIESKSDELNRLIDNLLSYSLLAAGKYPLELGETDLVRHLRVAAAGWYPLLEAEGFEVNVALPEHPVHWRTDLTWISRIVDNLLQNVIRHAKSGRYVEIALEEEDSGRYALVIGDHGPGLQSVSERRGAGIGLEIVALMARDLGLSFELSSSSAGTRAILREQNRA